MGLSWMREKMEHGAASASRYGTAFTESRIATQLSTHLQWLFLTTKSALPWRRKKRARGLPLPLPTPWPPLTMNIDSMDSIEEVTLVLERVSNQLILSLHDVCKNLHFWKARAEGAVTTKIRFMLLERGPYAFIQLVVPFVNSLVSDAYPTRGFVVKASSQISERVAFLSALQQCLAKVLSDVHKRVDKFGDNILKGQTSEAICSVLVHVHKAMATLEGSYDLPHDTFNDKEDRNSMILQFEMIPDELLKKNVWMDTEIVSCLNVISTNLDRFEGFFSFLVSKYMRPRRVARNWIRYTGAGLGLAITLGWVAQHSALMGSPDLEIWLKEGGEAVIAFYKEHVERPLLSIKDDLFETFKRRHHGAAELADVNLTADSLRRMLIAFVEEASGGQIHEGASEQELMEVVVNRYEREVTHPLKNMLGGELFRAMLIQVQKLKLDIETAMLELNQILRANEINFAVLAALPALLFAILFGWLLRVSLSQSKGEEGRGRAARLRRRLLLAKVERTIVACQIAIDGSQQEEASWHYGMVIYYLDRLYKAVERHAIASGEWSSLQNDILDLARPNFAIYYKLATTAKMERIYECIISRCKEL